MNGIGFLKQKHVLDLCALSELILERNAGSGVPLGTGQIVKPTPIFTKFTLAKWQRRSSSGWEIATEPVKSRSFSCTLPAEIHMLVCFLKTVV